MNRLGIYTAAAWLILVLAVPAVATVYHIPLKNFMAVDVIRLEGIRDSSEDRKDRIPISARWQVQRAVLRFDHVCSSALLRDTSRLKVAVNDHPVAQIALDPRTPEGRAEAAIDPALLPTGYNRLVFSVIQHGTQSECEDPSAPELWTQVDLTTAELELDVRPLPVPVELSAVGSFLFDSRDLISDAVHVVVSEITPANLKRAGLAAAGAALRRGYRPVLITLSDGLAPDRDNLVIGPPAFLDALGIPLVSMGGDTTTGAVLALTAPPPIRNGENPQPEADPFHAVIYMSGTTDAELDRAARAFSLLATPFPPKPAVGVQEMLEPPLAAYRFHNAADAGREYSLASLGLPTTSFKGVHPAPRGVTFRLPSDVHIEPNHPLILSVNLAYGSGMRTDSALNVDVNGKFMAAIPLDDPAGGVFRGYKVRVLSALLRPGLNTIRFVPVLTPPLTSKCAPVQEGNLVVTLFEDSFISLPKYSHWTRMPRLDAFFIDGFPFGRWPDLRESAVCLPAATFESAAAAVNLVAMIAQKIGYPPTGLVWETGDGVDPDRDVILIGTRETLNTPPFSEWLSDSMPLGAGAWIPEPHLERPSGRESSGRDWLAAVRQWFGRLPEPLPRERLTDQARGKFNTIGPPGWGSMVECVRPENAQRTLLALSAESPGDILQTARLAWRSEIQAAAGGGALAVRLDPGEPRSWILDDSGTYYLGAVGPLPRVDNFINAHPLWALILVLGLLVICCLLIYALLRHVRHRRLQNA